ncbi:MAG TPA: DUF3102 domain-containing protein [Bacteroidales bacterium]|nr:DUF3102 domain-containing protein [Bacteroidales bacterium]
MIKINEKNQRDIVNKRNQILTDTKELETDELKYLLDSCIGLNYNEKDEGCKECGNYKFCKEIEDKLKDMLNIKSEEPKKKETKKEVAKVENKEVKKEKTVVDAVVLKFDYNKIEADQEVITTIKNVTKDIKRSQNSIVSSMVEMGEMLNRMKVMIKTNWLEWLAIELDMSSHQAYSAINIWKRFGKKVNQISDKIAYTTLGQLASDAYTDEEIDATIKAVNHEQIKGTLSDIQDFIKKMRLESNKTNEPEDEEDEKPAAKKDKKIDNKIDISDEEISFDGFIKEAQAFLDILESTGTVSENQFNQLKQIKDITASIARELELKLTEVKM